MILEGIGMAGSALFAVAVAPTAWAAWRDGKTAMPAPTAWLLWTALIFYTTYLFGSFGFHLPFVSGVGEVAGWSVVLRYKYFPRRA